MSRRWPPIVLGALLACWTAVNSVQSYLISRNAAQAGTPELAPADIVNAFHVLSYYSPSTWFENRWLGVPAQQNPEDAWITQEILSEIRPDFVVEAGAAYGGGAALWATVLEQVNPNGKVISIDIEDRMGEARRLPVVQRRVQFLIGSSTGPDIVAEVWRQVEGHSAVVILDSDHSRDHVAREIEAYAGLVPVGSYLIVQDTNVNGHPVLPEFGPGPMEAVDEFLATTDAFVPDPSRERLLLTYHPRGYLKRVK